LKDEFLGLISHEMKSPLTVILGGLGTLIKDGDNIGPVERDELIKDAYLEAESLTDIVSNLLELSRWQAGHLKLDSGEADIRVAVRAMVDRTRGQYTKHRFRVDVPRQLPRARADRMRLERILYNLLNNAAKYSPKGTEVRVRVRMNSMELVIGVCD